MSKSTLLKVSIFIVNCVSFIIFSLPRSWSLTLGRFVGIALLFLGYRKKVVISNLERAFGNVTSQRLTNVYIEMGKLFSELLMLFGGVNWFAVKFATIEGLEHWAQAKSIARENGTGVILISHHGGNWEVMLSRGALAGIDILMVTKLLKPRWLHDAIEKGRRKSGILATYEPRTLKDVLSHLKRNGTVGFVLDQYAGPPIGIRVPFFGVPVGTASIVATLVKRTGAPVLLASNTRSKDGRFNVRISPPISWISELDPKKELALNTARYTEVIERSIRENPDQWLWAHRRFKGDLSPIKDDEWIHGRARH